MLVAARERLRDAALAGTAVAGTRDPVLAHRHRARRQVRRRRRGRRREARRPAAVSCATSGGRPGTRRPDGGRSRWACVLAAAAGVVLLRGRGRALVLCLVGHDRSRVSRRKARRVGRARVEASDLSRARSSRSQSRRRPSGSLDAGPAVAVVGVALLVAAEVGWAWQRTPPLFEWEPDARQAARAEAEAWIADDEQAGRRALRLRAALPRSVGAEPPLLPHDRRAPGGRPARAPGDRARSAARTGRLGARRERAEQHPPQPRDRAPAARACGSPSRRAAFGPFLVLRSREPTVTPETFLYLSARALLVGRSLGIGDADVNLRTVVLAAAGAAGLRPLSPLSLEQLAVARRALERCEAGLHGPSPAAPGASQSGGDGRGSDHAAEHEGSHPIASPALVRLVTSNHETIVGDAGRLARGSRARRRGAGRQPMSPRRPTLPLGSCSRRAAKARTSPPGRPRSARRHGGSESAATIRPAGSSPSGSAGSAWSSRAPSRPRAPASIVSLVDRERRAFDVPRPRGRRSVDGRRAPARVARLRPPARLGVRAPGRADRAGRRERRGAGPRGGRADQRRPFVVEHDPRQRCGPFSRARRVARSRRRVRERGRGPCVRRQAARGRVDPEARGPRVLVRRGRAALRCLSPTSSTRPEPATRSRRAGSSADPTSRSRPPRAASSAWAPCPERCARHRLDAKAPLTRGGSAASLTSGHRGCPRGWLSRCRPAVLSGAARGARRVASRRADDGSTPHAEAGTATHGAARRKATGEPPSAV